MRKGYKFKLEPTHEQAVLINKTLGCCRWVYNNALDKKSKAFNSRLHHFLRCGLFFIRKILDIFWKNSNIITIKKGGF